MQNLNPTCLLMIEPDKLGKPSKIPVNDEITKKVEEILASSKEGTSYKGCHVTKCGVESESCDLIILGIIVTNSLAKYYVQYYRKYIPEGEIKKIHHIHNLISRGFTTENFVDKAYKEAQKRRMKIENDKS